jgi:hypothetical protein
MSRILRRGSQYCALFALPHNRFCERSRGQPNENDAV